MVVLLNCVEDFFTRLMAVILCHYGICVHVIAYTYIIIFLHTVFFSRATADKSTVGTY